MGRASRTKRERRSDAANGDCYESAARFMLGLPSAARDGFRLCHGVVTGNGEPVIGVRFGHAWVEVGDTVFDFSNGQETMTRRERYYDAASIDPSEVVRYEWLDAATMLVKARHYGPWHNDGVSV